MLSRTSIQKTKNLFHNTLHNLTSLFFKGYQKLHKQPLLSCRFGNEKKYLADECYSDFYSECDFNSVQERKIRSENAVLSPNEPKKEGESLERKKQNQIIKKKKEREKEKNDQNVRKGGSPYALAQKMKALDMMDAGDKEQMSDVEEALRCYSQIKSPTYVDIVDNFFIDMYSEFSGPQPSSSVNNSKRRLGSRRY